jgi:hypothetical protein
LYYTSKGSSGSPILKLQNNKIICIHYACSTKENNNCGMFLSYSIEKFQNYYNQSHGFNKEGIEDTISSFLFLPDNKGKNNRDDDGNDDNDNDNDDDDNDDNINNINNINDDINDDDICNISGSLNNSNNDEIKSKCSHNNNKKKSNNNTNVNKNLLNNKKENDIQIKSINFNQKLNEQKKKLLTSFSKHPFSTRNESSGGKKNKPEWAEKI